MENKANANSSGETTSDEEKIGQLEVLCSACLSEPVPEGLGDQLVYDKLASGQVQNSAKIRYSQEHHRISQRLGLSLRYLQALGEPVTEGIAFTLDQQPPSRVLLVEEVRAWVGLCSPVQWVTRYPEQWNVLLKGAEPAVLEAALVDGISRRGEALDEYLVALALTVPSRNLFSRLLSLHLAIGKSLHNKQAEKKGAHSKAGPASNQPPSSAVALPYILCLWLLTQKDPILAHLLIALKRRLEPQPLFSPPVQKFLAQHLPSVQQLQATLQRSRSHEDLELYRVLHYQGAYVLQEEDWLALLVPSRHLHRALDMMGKQIPDAPSRTVVRDRVMHLLLTCPPELCAWQEQYLHLIRPYLNTYVKDHLAAVQAEPSLIYECRTWGMGLVHSLPADLLRGPAARNYVEQWISREEEPPSGTNPEILDQRVQRRLRDLPLVAKILLAGTPGHLPSQKKTNAEDNTLPESFYARVLFAATIASLPGLQLCCLQRCKSQLPKLQEQVNLLGQMIMGQDLRIHRFLHSAGLLATLPKSELGLAALQALRERDRPRFCLLWPLYVAQVKQTPHPGPTTPQPSPDPTAPEPAKTPNHFESREDLDMCRTASSLICEHHLPSLIGQLPATLAPHLLPMFLLTNDEGTCDRALAHFPLDDREVIEDYRQVLKTKGLHVALTRFQATYPSAENTEV